MSAEPARTLPTRIGVDDVLRFILPVLVLALGILAWDLAVRLFAISPFALPGPAAVFATIFADWPLLSLLSYLVLRRWHESAVRGEA